MPIKKSKYIGRVINGFKVLNSYHSEKPYRNTFYICECVLCGRVVDYACSSILNNKARCVCNRKKKNRNGFNIRDRIYNIYRSMIKRTQKPENKDYKNYGGRGVKICDEWNNDYRKFYDWAMSNGYNDDLSIDRIDVNGDYEPSNCRWVDTKIQANNTRTNRHIKYRGETLTISEWANKIGMKYGTLRERIRRGWSISKAIRTKIKR